ncbi:hypothetical protein H5407_23635, partial [Mitsuaria sp. WAJ17]|uniref:condensation domain-containing protein n=1 Tax=Mitsuaria sp. WAJ17 TaxID=2761452 RepID=UPI0015FEDAA5
GTVLFGRMQAGAGADRALGLYINTLPLRVKLQGPVLGAVKQVQQDLAGLLRHEHAPLALAQRCSGLESGVPLVTALLNYRHSSQGHASETALPEGTQVMAASEERTNYPLLLNIDDYEQGGLALTVQLREPHSAQALCEAMEQA